MFRLRNVHGLYACENTDICHCLHIDYVSIIIILVDDLIILLG